VASSVPLLRGQGLDQNFQLLLTQVGTKEYLTLSQSPIIKATSLDDSLVVEDFFDSWLRLFF
jgi:hypothetical protein